MEINVLEFLTEEHKKKISEKLDEAIEKIDTSKLAKKIEKDLSDCEYGMYIFDELDFTETANKLKEKINQLIFNK